MEKLNRYFPVMNMNFGEPYAEMEPDSTGDYVRIDDVAEWIKLQRNDIPVTGEELANGFLYAIGEIED